MSNEYQHGADIYGVEGIKWDFSSNINPLGVPASFKKMMREHLDDFGVYPDYRYSQLKQAISNYLGVNTDHIIVDNGLVELMAKVIKMKKFNRLVTVSPTFLEYERIANLSELEVLNFPLHCEEEFCLKTEAFISTFKKNDLIIICNPNNPTGTLYTQEQMMDIAQGAHNVGAFLVIDEAFMELTSNKGNDTFLQVIDSREAFKSVMVFRAITKYFGLPGLRLGYGMTRDKEMLTYFGKHIGPWQLNTGAALCAPIFIDKEYRQCTDKWLEKEIDWVYQQLRQIENLTVFRSKTMFHLIRLHHMNNRVLKKMMMEDGILIRDNQGFRGLNESYIRLAVKNREANLLLLECLTKYIGGIQ